MARQASFVWYGDQVAADAVDAAHDAAIAVVDDSVEEARRNTPVLSGEARESLRREDSAGDEIAWGYHVDHGFYIEVGANGRPGLYPMRRAADIHYGRLPAEAARRFRYGA